MMKVTFHVVRFGPADKHDSFPGNYYTVQCICGFLWMPEADQPQINSTDKSFVRVPASSAHAFLSEHQ
jgi:hypothetical protein